MPVERITISRLPAAERAELEDILAEFARQKLNHTARFHSDEGDTLAWFLLLGLAALGGIIASFVEQVPAEIIEAFSGGYFFTSLPYRPVWLGFILSLIVLPYTIAVFFRVHRRCGWAVASFGLMRVFGPRLKLIRFADVAAAERHRTQSQHRRISWLVLTSRNGQKLTLYSSPITAAVLERLPPTVTVRNA